MIIIVCYSQGAENFKEGAENISALFHKNRICH
jgi:hypothetical protein